MSASEHPPVVLSAAAREVLARAYAEPHRAYHDAQHIAELLAWFDWVAREVGWQRPTDVYLAIMFHDAVYDPRATDNEARSADLARAHGANARTVELIQLTARHGALTPEALDADARHFLDCDTAILGAEPAAFDRYDAAIRAEYAHVPDDAYRAGRRAFLARMQAQPRIFLSDLFHARLDAAARANLTRALARL